MLEKYYKELAAIYDHLIKKREKAGTTILISTLSQELTIDIETLRSDIEYLDEKEYIEAKILYEAGKIAEVRILRMTAKGRDIIEEKQK
jgi:hypothetical protein